MKKIQNITAIVITLAWLIYAVANASTQMSYLEAGVDQGWNNQTALSNLTAKANGRVLGQDAFLDMQGNISKVLNQTVLLNMSITKSDSGKLEYTSFYPYEVKDYQEVAQKIGVLNEALEAQNVKLSFLNCSDSYSGEGTGAGGLTLANQEHRIDEMLYMLRGYGVNYFDARELLRDAGTTPEESAYQTDTRQTITASWEIALSLLDKLEVQEGKWSDPDNYEIEVHEDAFVGNIGKRIGMTYAQEEDFTVIKPNFETDFTLSYVEKEDRFAVRGDFTETILYKEQAIQSDSKYDRDMRSLYLMQPYAYRKIVNNDNANEMKVLVVGNEAVLPVASFLALGVSEIDVVWPYSAPLDSGSLIKFVEDEEYDHVIIGLSAEEMAEGYFGFLDGIEVK